MPITIWLVFALILLAAVIAIFIYKLGQVANYGIDYDIDTDDLVVRPSVRPEPSDNSGGK